MLWKKAHGDCRSPFWPAGQSAWSSVSVMGLLAGLHLPPRVGWRELIVGAFIAASGFSIGLFFCTALLPPGQLRSELSMGVLLCLVAAPLAMAGARVMRVGRFAAAD